jgi:hypothetical protein
VHVVLIKDKVPDLRIRTVKEITGLRLEHSVLVCDVNELEIILALLVSDISKIWVPLLAVLSDNQRIVLIVLLEEFLGIVIGCEARVSATTKTN